MRIILIIAAILLTFSTELLAQKDFKTLDKETYDYFVKGDYKNLKKTSDTMLLLGIDYYYLRMRLGILGYNKQQYQGAFNNFSKAIEFNSLDTISREYIYKSYLYAGRMPDANLYLESEPLDKRNNSLKKSEKPFSSEFYTGSSFTVYDYNLYGTNSLNYEAVKSSFSINAGLETYFSNRLRGTFSYTNYRKSGTAYTPANSSGKDLNFSQNQLYAKLTGFLFPGWEFSGFVHGAFYTEAITQGPVGNRISTNQTITEYLGGVGLSKNLWKIRTGANVSFSNFSNSNQIRGEGYLTWLPCGNLNLYFTTGWMGQTDNYWGGTYQVSQEVGFKIFKTLWMESGLVNGNSFLYARNLGLMMNNSFQIPVNTVYTNLILLPGRHLKLTITPYYSENQAYSWDMNAHTRTNKLTINSFGGLIKLTYKYR